MAWNPSPEVAAARDFGNKFNGNRVVIVWTTDDGRIGYASYGRTKKLCDETKGLAEAAYAAVMKELER